MLKQILSDSEWEDVKEFVSPKMFKILPAKTATRQFRSIVGNYFSRNGFKQAVAERQDWLDDKGLPIEVTAKSSGPLGGGALDGQQVLQLYFHQIYYGRKTLLDLRYRRFSPGEADASDGQKIEWAPQAYWIEWDRDFIEAARDLYLGFYQDDDARFEAGLDVMGLTCAKHTFLEHFGGGEQHKVSFRMERFIKTFRHTIRCCKEAEEESHPNLIPFGMYIVTLYDHLEQLGGEYDVRQAFFEAVDVDEFDQ